MVNSNDVHTTYHFHSIFGSKLFTVNISVSAFTDFGAEKSTDDDADVNTLTYVTV